MLGRVQHKVLIRLKEVEQRSMAAAPPGWRTVTRHRIPLGLPAMSPPLRARTAVSMGEGAFVCGDHRDRASIQGALVSGNRTAEAVHAALACVSR
jgi:hypothetical protein